MIVNLYAVFDSATGVYDGPIPGQADGSVIRAFSDKAVSDDNAVGQHPECYTLFRVGS